MEVNPKQPETDAEIAASEEVAALQSRYGRLEPEMLIDLALDRFFPEQIAAISSFGADSAVLLHMISEIDRTLPVIFLDTGKHFEETLNYRDALLDDFGITDLRVIGPRSEMLAHADPDGLLHASDPDSCCNLRKVEPMERAVEPFRAWFTGRKRFQARTRAQLSVFEAVGPRVRINPLARWTSPDIASYVNVHGLREHPLVAMGYLSIGCFPCTSPVAPDGDIRSGRWAGREKTECGIHFSPSGTLIRASALAGAENG